MTSVDMQGVAVHVGQTVEFLNDFGKLKGVVINPVRDAQWGKRFFDVRVTSCKRNKIVRTREKPLTFKYTANRALKLIGKTCRVYSHSMRVLQDGVATLASSVKRGDRLLVRIGNQHSILVVATGISLDMAIVVSHKDQRLIVKHDQIIGRYEDIPLAIVLVEQTTEADYATICPACGGHAVIGGETLIAYYGEHVCLDCGYNCAIDHQTTTLGSVDPWGYLEDLVWANECGHSRHIDYLAWMVNHHIPALQMVRLMTMVFDIDTQNAIVQCLAYLGRLGEYLIQEIRELLIDDWYVEEIMCYLHPRRTPRIIYLPATPQGEMPKQLSLFDLEAA